MRVRVPAALVVVLSLAAPPLVGIVCGVLCDAAHGHHAHHASAAAGGPVLVGGHVCDHDLGVVEVFGPSHGTRAPLPQMTAVALPGPGPAAPHPAAASWDQPLDRVSGPPARSPVLRI